MPSDRATEPTSQTFKNYVEVPAEIKKQAKTYIPRSPPVQAILQRRGIMTTGLTSLQSCTELRGILGRQTSQIISYHRDRSPQLLLDVDLNLPYTQYSKNADVLTATGHIEPYITPKTCRPQQPSRGGAM